MIARCLYSTPRLADSAGVSVGDDQDLYLMLLHRIGASEAVVDAARDVRTDGNFVPARADQVDRLQAVGIGEPSRRGRRRSRR